MARVAMCGQMAASTTEIGKKTKSKDMVHTLGLMVVNLLVHGRTITCMGTVSTLGKTVGNTKGIMIWTKSTALELTNGLMVEDMKAIGKMGSSMAKVSTFYQMEKLKLESGITENECNGLMNDITLLYL